MSFMETSTPEAVNEEEVVDYNSMTKSQLQELLTERQVEWTTAMLKVELVALAEGSE